MKISIFFPLLILFIASNSLATTNGSQAYTPTALEWLELQCRDIATWLPKIDAQTGCMQKEPNTMIITVTYNKQATKKQAEQKFIQISEGLQLFAKSKGWLWLKTEKIVSPRSYH